MTELQVNTSPGDRAAQASTMRAYAADGELHVLLAGRLLRYPAIWLRDNCPCSECADPVSGQRLNDVTHLPVNPVVTSATGDGAGLGAVSVTFGPDGHQGVFEGGWLAGHALDGYDDGDEKRLWHTPGELGAVPEVSWPEYAADPAERLRALDAVLRDGFVLLRGTRTEPGTVLDVAATFGHVRETNYGRLFDVRIEPAPGNLAFTSREIFPHTDNPYRDPVPTLQLLHCLRAADEGGESGLVDGFAAAAALRAADPEGFDLLTRTAVRYDYQDGTAALTASQPPVQLGARGQVRAIRYNNRSARPVRLPYEQVSSFYRAWRGWAELLAGQDRRLRLRLRPGDCLIFDNTRVLHARTAYSVTGRRHLQGCYADIDGLASTARLLRAQAS